MSVGRMGGRTRDDGLAGVLLAACCEPGADRSLAEATRTFTPGGGRRRSGRLWRCGFGAVLVVAFVLAVSGSASAATAWVYVTNIGSGTVTPIEVATNKPGAEIKVGKEPDGVAVTPDGKTVYVTNIGSGTVTPIEVATNKPGPEIKVGSNPVGIAVTPDGKTVYVTNYTSGTVTPIEVATNKPGPEITVGSHPVGIAVTPDGKTAYVSESGTVTPIEVATNHPRPPIILSGSLDGIAVTPDGKTAYVSESESFTVVAIEVATNKPGPVIPVGSNPVGIAITRVYQAPTVTKVSATSGPVTGDKVVTITGTNFSVVGDVEFSGVPVSDYVINQAGTEIGVVSPAREVAGTVDVTVKTPGGTSKITTKDHYKYLPVITSVEPNSGSTAGGETIIVFGFGFKPGEDENTFAFGTASAPSSLCFAGSPGNCLVTSPPHAAGKVDVKATVNGATSAKTKADQYTYK